MRGFSRILMGLWVIAWMVMPVAESRAQEAQPEEYLGYDSDAERDIEQLTRIAPAAGERADRPVDPKTEHRQGATALTPIEQEVADQFNLWKKTLETGTPQDMARLYDEDAVLIPAFSNQTRTTRDAIAAYFKFFMAFNPRVILDEQHLDVLDGNTAIHTGRCTFEVIRAGRPHKIPARFTFVYEKEESVWRIRHDHTSQMPEPAPTHITKDDH